MFEISKKDDKDAKDHKDPKFAHLEVLMVLCVLSFRGGDPHLDRLGGVVLLVLTVQHRRKIHYCVLPKICFDKRFVGGFP